MNTFKFLDSFPIDDETFHHDMSSLRHKLFSFGVCWTDSVKGAFDKETPFRVVLYTKPRGSDFKNPLVKECNGIIFEYNNGWKLLAMPQYGFCNNKISMNRLNEMYKSGYYSVYEVLDATILTLYYYNQSWRISSTKSYDIGGMDIVKGTTFNEAIDDLIATKYNAFNFNNLQKDYSYTIALRYPKYHIFDETKYLMNRTKNVPKQGIDMNAYIMLLASANLNTYLFSNKHVPGIPMQTPITFQESNVNTLVNYAKCAYSKYLKAYSRQDFRYKPLHGYILRANNKNVPHEYSTIYIESQLYEVIKCGLYKNNNTLRNQEFNKLIVYMFMNNERLAQYKILFEQFDKAFSKLEKNINFIVQESYDMIINKKPSSGNVIVDAIALKYKSMDDITHGFINDILFSEDYIHHLYKLV